MQSKYDSGVGEDVRTTIARDFIRLFFPETLGGTELTVPIDHSASSFTSTISGIFSGTLCARGNLTLGYEQIRCEATNPN